MTSCVPMTVSVPKIRNAAELHAVELSVRLQLQVLYYIIL